jgi:hypothetical protein
MSGDDGADRAVDVALGGDFDVGGLGLGGGDWKTFEFHPFNVKLDRVLHIFHGFLGCAAS